MEEESGSTAMLVALAQKTEHPSGPGIYRYLLDIVP